MQVLSVRHLHTSRRSPALLFAGLLLLALAGCAQSRTQGESGSTGNEDQRAEAIQNFEIGAPMNGREISNGPGIFTGREGGFVIFRK